MSRIGNRALSIPSGVEVRVENNTVIVKGPKGELKQEFVKGINVEVKDNAVIVTRSKETLKPFHGTTNALIKNMIEGVLNGYEKSLQIVGVGYKFNVQGKNLTVQAGYSNPVEVKVPENLEVEQVSNTEIKVKGIEKQAVGEFSANIRKIREPEPYKGKGIKYKDEHIRRKEGKKAA